MLQHQRFYVAGVLVALATASTASFAADPATTDNSNKQPAVPYRAENATEKLTSDASKVKLERRTDGSRSYHLNGEGMQSISAHIGVDGKLTMECSDDADKAIQAASAENNVHEK